MHNRKDGYTQGNLYIPLYSVYTVYSKIMEPCTVYTQYNSIIVLICE